MKCTFMKVVMILFLMLGGDVYNVESHISTSVPETVIVANSHEDLNEIIKRETKQEIWQEVLTFIENSHNKDITNETRNEIATHIVEQALEENVDICFVLAQGKLETNIGEFGIGKTRKSIFGIYKYFDSYADGIDFYIRTLKKNYLTNGRTEKDLMSNYVHKGGYRYAANPNYEIELKEAYNFVRAATNIYDLQKSYENQ